MIYNNLKKNKNNIVEVQNKLILHFVRGPYAEIKGNKSAEYKIEFINNKTGEILYQSTINNNCWCKCNFEYFVEWKVRVYENEKLWKESLDNGWFVTNDLGEIVDGKLFVLGRADDVIISGGENLSLNTVESILNENFPDIQCAAFSVDDPQWGHTLHIAVVGQADSDDVATVLESKIGTFAKPKGIHRMSSLPLLGIGKIDRKSLAKGIANE